MRTALPFALLALLALAPLVAAQDEAKPQEEPKPEEGGNAWVEDCPPDMMCAFGGSQGVDCREEENKDIEQCKDCQDCVTSHMPAGDNATYSGDCGAEMCAYGGSQGVDCREEENRSLEQCKDCQDCVTSHAPAGDNATYSGDCGAEMCAYGEDDCIECSGPVSRGPEGSCMDGSDCNTDPCPHCRTLGGEGGDATLERDDAAQTGSGQVDANKVPGLALGGILATLGLLGLALRRR